MLSTITFLTFAVFIVLCSHCGPSNSNEISLLICSSPEAVLKCGIRVAGDICSNNSETASMKVYDAYTCAAYGHDTSQCLNKEDMCPAITWLVPVVLVVYTLVTQVLMLNLVIAMFR